MGLKIYTIGIGQKDPAAIDDFLFGRGHNMDTRTLQQVAKLTGGQFFLATDTDKLNEIYTLINQLESSEHDVNSYRLRDELFHWPLGLAMLLSLLVVMLRVYPQWHPNRWRRRQPLPNRRASLMENATLHFLRPEWLLALIPAFWLVWKLWKQSGRQGAWNAIISPRFKPVLLGEKSEESVFPWPVLGLAILWSIAIIALSGPSWKQVDVPAEKNRQGTVILFDLSLSMLSDDLKPNRLSRARYKVLDLLKAHPELNVGMVAYAGTAHTIAPISEDNQTLLALTPNLSPLIMPSFGANAVAGFEQAQTLFKGAHVKQGHILWVTDDVEASELAAITEQVKQHHLQLSILVVGTPNGGPIQVPNYGLIKDENGKIVMAKVPFQRFQSLAQQTDATLSTLSMQDVDTTQLLPDSLSGFDSDNQPSSDKTLSNWLDEGVYLLWLLVPLGALAYRRGWAFSWLSVGLLGLMLSGGLISPSPAWAKEVKTDDNTSVTLLDVFKSPDQQGYENG